MAFKLRPDQGLIRITGKGSGRGALLKEGPKCRQGAWHDEELKGEQGDGMWYKIRPWDHSEELGVSLKENESIHEGF